MHFMYLTSSDSSKPPKSKTKFSSECGKGLTIYTKSVFLFKSSFSFSFKCFFSLKAKLASKPIFSSL